MTHLWTMALGLAAFLIVLAAQSITGSLALPVATAIVVLILTIMQSRRFQFTHFRLGFIENQLRDVDRSVIALEHVGSPPRVLGRPISIRWDRGTVAPDLAEYLVQVMMFRRPTRVLECGMGASTRLIAASIQALGVGRLVSLEHDESWVHVVRKHLEGDGLSPFVTLIHSPLVECTHDGRTYRWYDDGGAIRSQGPFDIVFVDGPPGNAPEDPGREAAMFAIFESLSPRGVLLLDDGNRPGEMAAAERWKTYFGGRLHAQLVDLTKGLWVFERIG